MNSIDSGGPRTLGGPRSVAAEMVTDGTEAVPPAAGAGADATERVPPVRKCPSKNSVFVYHDNRPVILFVTVNANNRQWVFDNDEAVSCILAAWKDAARWVVGRYVVMPDHIHFFCTPASSQMFDFHKWMSYWKSVVARTFPVSHELPLWQRECWDVQMRSAEGYYEKSEYMRHNPVRKKLVERPEEWPYQGVLNVLEWHDA